MGFSNLNLVLVCCLKKRVNIYEFLREFYKHYTSLVFSHQKTTHALIQKWPFRGSVYCSNSYGLLLAFFMNETNNF